MRNRTIETAATAIVVATLVFGMVLTMPSTPQYGELDVSSETYRQNPSTGFGLLKQPERF